MQHHSRSRGTPCDGTPIGQPRGARTLGSLAKRVAICVLLAHAAIPAVVSGQQESAGEYEVKAAMLHNLANFVEWPESAYPDPHAHIVLCILGRDPFGNSLTSATLHTRANTAARVLVRRLENDRDVRACHILYISSSERKTIGQVLSTLKSASVLTVGEMTLFAEQGGMIQFSLDDQRVRFDINPDAASRAGLRISSKLLALAKLVRH